MLVSYKKNNNETISDFVLQKKEYYNGNPLAKRGFVKHHYTEEMVREYIKCKTDIHYFINTYVKTVSIDEGVIPLFLYDYQEDLIHNYINNRFNISLQSRQTGKSVTTCAFLLHTAIFNSDENIAILANKGSNAQSVLMKLTGMMDRLPHFLKPGMLVYNKRSIQFDNGSRIFSASSSSASIRGETVSLLYLDEAAFIPNDIEFYESTYPTITSGKKSRVIMTSTPKGARGLFYKIYTDAINGNNEYVATKVLWNQVPGRDETFKEETIKNTSYAQWLQEFEVNFLGSQNTLIESSTLQTLVHFNPISENENWKMYEEPKEGKKYVVSVDSAEGVNKDYSAFIVIDITKMPYTVVGVYRNKTITPLIYPTIIHGVAKEYNEALILCENNNIGQIVANTLYYDLEYENMILTGTRKGRQVIGGTNLKPGVKTTVALKSIGCSTMKTMIENSQIKLNDIDLISELGTFVSKGKSYEADLDCNDDIVASLFIFSWLTTQDYFKEYSENDIRQTLINNNEALISSLAPFGFINDGIEDEISVSSSYFDDSFYSEADNTSFF